MFLKISVLKKFANINGETPVFEPLLKKVAGLQTQKPATLLKRDCNTGVFL